MTRKTNTKAVLITREQYAALEHIQRRDSQISTTGAAPTINAIARTLLDKALAATNQDKTA